MKPALGNDYLNQLKNRSKKSRVRHRFQLVGLDIAMFLEDERHKSLYIKMAKEGDAEKLFSIAKDISDRSRIKNKGAYFMRLVHKNKKKIVKKQKTKPGERKKIVNV